MALPNAEYVSALVTRGPPALLVICLVVLLGLGATQKVDIKRTLVLSGIAVVFFIIWMVELPNLDKRTIIIFASDRPSVLKEYSLMPVEYSIGEVQPVDLDSSSFYLPDGREPLKMTFDLRPLILSYERNLHTVVKVARADPKCFDEASAGVEYASVAATLQTKCPFALVHQDQVQ